MNKRRFCAFVSGVSWCRLIIPCHTLLQRLESVQSEAIALTRGPKGTTVRLTIVPVGEDDTHVRVVSFVRAELKALAAWGDGVLLTNGTKAPDIEMVGLAKGASER